MYKFEPLNMRSVRQTQRFDCIGSFLAFARKHRMYLTDRDIQLMLKQDAEKENGTLYNTSYGRLRKGEELMTEYTSF